MSGSKIEKGKEEFVRLCEAAFRRFGVEAAPGSANMVLAKVMAEAYVGVRCWESLEEYKKNKREFDASSWLNRRWFNRGLYKWDPDAEPAE